MNSHTSDGEIGTGEGSVKTDAALGVGLSKQDDRYVELLAIDMSMLWVGGPLVS